MKFYKTLGLLAACISIAACDDDGDSIGPRPDLTISGQAMKGAIVNAPIDVYRANSDGSISARINGGSSQPYTDASGNYSVELDGDDYRGDSIVIVVGEDVCDAGEGNVCEDVEQNPDFDVNNNGQVDHGETFNVGSYRCDNSNGCVDSDGTSYDFGDLVPLDFSLRVVVPEVSSSNSVRSQTANINVLTTLAFYDVVNQVGELAALAANDKMANIFQLDGVDIVTQSMVDLTTLSGGENVGTASWLLSAVNAGILASTTVDDGTTTETISAGQALSQLQLEYQEFHSGKSAFQLYIKQLTSGSGGNADANSNRDLESFYDLADQLTTQFDSSVSDAAKTQLQNIIDDIATASDGDATNEQASDDILAQIQEQLEPAKTFSFDTVEWYGEEVAEGDASDKFNFIMDSAWTGAQETVGYFEVLGNDFTLLLAAALELDLNDGLGTTVTLTTQDKDGNDVTATVAKAGSIISVNGQYLNTEFNGFSFTATEDTDALPTSRPEGEEDDTVYRFDIQINDSNYTARNEGLSLTFREGRGDSVDDNALTAISLQVDGDFDGTDATVVRSSFSWPHIELAQLDISEYSDDVGRLTVSGQLIFTFEHIDDSDDSTVVEQDGRKFSILQVGILSSQVFSIFELTIGENGSNSEVTIPAHVGFTAYNPEEFGSFEPAYLQANESACEILELQMAFAITEDDSDNSDYNNSPLIMKTDTNSEGEEVDRELSYSYQLVREFTDQFDEAQKDPDDICAIEFPVDDTTVSIDMVQARSESSSAAYMSRVFNYQGLKDSLNDYLTQYITSPSTEDPDLPSASSFVNYNDCSNTGSIQYNSAVVGQFYSCEAEPATSDGYCDDTEADLYRDYNASPYVGSLITGYTTDDEGNISFDVGQEDYTSCSSSDSEWEIRYIDGNIQSLPYDTSMFGRPGQDAP